MSKSIIKKVSPFVALIIICFIVFVEIKSVYSSHNKTEKETKQEVKVNKDVKSTNIKEPLTEVPKIVKETPKTNGSTSSTTKNDETTTDTSSTVTSDQSTTTDANSNNTSKTTTPSADTTSSTTTSTSSPTTTTVKVLYANGKLIGKGDEVQLTRSPFSIKILDNGKQTGGYQGEYSETITFTVKDENGNLLDTPSKPSDYGTIQTLTYTPAIQGQGTIQQSAALSYKALVLNDGSGNLVMGNTSKVTFEAVPAQGWEFKEWKVATYTETNSKLTYGFSETQKITGNDYITAVFVQNAGTN